MSLSFIDTIAVFISVSIPFIRRKCKMLIDSNTWSLFDFFLISKILPNQLSQYVTLNLHLFQHASILMPNWPLVTLMCFWVNCSFCSCLLRTWFLFKIVFFIKLIRYISQPLLLDFNFVFNLRGRVTRPPPAAASHSCVRSNSCLSWRISFKFCMEVYRGKIYTPIVFGDAAPSVSSFIGSEVIFWW